MGRPRRKILSLEKYIIVLYCYSFWKKHLYYTYTSLQVLWKPDLINNLRQNIKMLSPLIHYSKLWKVLLRGVYPYLVLTRKCFWHFKSQWFFWKYVCENQHRFYLFVLEKAHFSWLEERIHLHWRDLYRNP